MTLYKFKIPVSALQIDLFDGISELSNLKVSGAKNTAEKSWCVGVKSDLNAALMHVVAEQAKITDARFLKSLRIPEIKACKPQGILLNATFELCYGVLRLAASLEVSDSIHYQSSAEWWKLCALEYADGMLNSVCRRTTKRKIEAGIGEMVRELKAGINPFNSETDPHHFNLIEASLLLKRHLPSDNDDVTTEKRDFCRRQWKSYLTALRGLKSFIHENSSLKAAYRNDFGEFVAITEGRRELKLFV